MHNALISPPSTPLPQLCRPPTPESRIGNYLAESLQLRRILGTGAYGVVYEAYDYYTGISYAVKALSKTNANGEPLDQRQQEFQAREIRHHYSASSHPNIVSMLKIIDAKDCTYVILEYCPEGDLFSNITEKGRYVSNDDHVKKAFLQILNAVEHCHRMGIYHRDLKPENILVSNSGSKVLLADFGLATDKCVSDDHGCGSTFYMSPECLDQSSRNLPYRCAPNDIWSLGVILVNLTCGRNPWKSASTEDSTYQAFTRNPAFLKSILPLSDELNDILGMIFEHDPRRRITVGQLKERIMACQYFTASTQLPSPPQSPLFSPVCESPRSPSSDNGSDTSEGSAGSLVLDDTPSEFDSDDCSISDDESLPATPITDSDYDSTYGSISEGSFEIVTPPVQRPHAKQLYVLPSEEYYRTPVQKPMSNVAPTPYIQAWVYNGYSYEQVQSAPQVYHPHPAPYAHHPYSPFQREGCYYR